MTLSDPAIIEAFLEIVPEIQEYYGKEAQVEIVTSIQSDSEYLVDFDTDYGIVFGPNNTAKLIIDVYVT